MKVKGWSVPRVKFLVVLGTEKGSMERRCDVSLMRLSAMERLKKGHDSHEGRMIYPSLVIVSERLLILTRLILFRRLIHLLYSVAHFLLNIFGLVDPAFQGFPVLTSNQRGRWGRRRGTSRFRLLW